MATGTSVPPTLREYRPAWEVHAALRFASCPYEVQALPFPDAPGDRAVDPLGPPVLVDGRAIAQGTERCLMLVQSNAADIGALTLRHEQPEMDRGAIDALLNLVLTKLEAVATYVEFVSDPKRSEAPERALTPTVARWLLRRQRSARAAAVIEAAGITREDDARQAAEQAYAALGAVLSSAAERDCEDAADDSDEDDGPFFLGAKPCLLDAAVFGHMMRVRGTVADAWMEASGYLKPLAAHRDVVLRRYFGGAGIARPSDAVRLLGPHWASVAEDLVGEREDAKGWNVIAIGLAAVIIGTVGVLAVRTAAVAPVKPSLA